MIVLLPVALIASAFVRGAVAPPKIGEAAPDFTWTALDGSKVTLSKLTAKGPVVLILLRGYPGYQCPFCTRQVGELMSSSEKFDKVGASVVLVYPGTSDGLKAHADEFVAGKNIPKNFSFVMDPDFAFTEKYGLRWSAPHETSFPSTFVIDGKGKVTFAKISRTHGGRTKSDEILTALSAPAMPATPVTAAP